MSMKEEISEWEKYWEQKISGHEYSGNAGSIVSILLAILEIYERLEKLESKND